MDIFLSINNREEVIQLPIIPETFGIEFASNNETFNTISQGDLNLIGTRGLRSMTIETFFPNREYPYAKSKDITGDEFIEKVLMWINRRLPIRIVVANKQGLEVINMAVTIDTFNYYYDKVGDVIYTLGFREFRFVEV